MLVTNFVQKFIHTGPWPAAGLDGIVARIQFGWVHFGIVSGAKSSRD